MADVKQLYNGGDAALKAGVHIGVLYWAVQRGDPVSTSGFQHRRKPLYSEADVERFIKQLKARRKKNGA